MYGATGESRRCYELVTAKTIGSTLNYQVGTFRFCFTELLSEGADDFSVVNEPIDGTLHVSAYFIILHADMVSHRTWFYYDTNQETIRVG